MKVKMKIKVYVHEYQQFLDNPTEYPLTAGSLYITGPGASDDDTWISVGYVEVDVPVLTQEEFVALRVEGVDAVIARKREQAARELTRLWELRSSLLAIAHDGAAMRPGDPADDIPF